MIRIRASLVGADCVRERALGGIADTVRSYEGSQEYRAAMFVSSHHGNCPERDNSYGHTPSPLIKFTDR